MAQGSILTNAGLAKLTSATPLAQVNITQFAAGDGGGGYPVLDPAMTSLTNEVWRGTASTPIRDPNNPSVLIFEANIPPSDGGYFVRELALFDDEGTMIAIGQTPVIEKPAPGTDQGISLVLRMYIALQNADQVTLVYDGGTGTMDHSGLGNRTAFDAHPQLVGNLLTIAEVRSTPGVSDGQQISMLGRDGRGQMLLEWDATNNDPDNDEDVFAVTGVGIGRWVAVKIKTLSGLKSLSKSLGERLIGLESIAELSGLVGEYDGQQVSVKGYHEGTDIGGGTFYWDSARTAENDGGIVIDGWVRLLGDYVIPEMFGAMGTGNDDDTDACQSAINTLREVRGRGAYLVDALSIPSYARLKKLEFIAKAGITEIGILLFQDEAEGCIIEACKIAGRKELQTSAVNGIVATGQHHSLTKNTITDVSGSGFSLVPPFSNSAISHNAVFRPDRRGITHELSLTEKSHFVRILHNIIEDTGISGIALISGLDATGESSAGCVDWIIDGNLVSNTGLLTQAGGIGGYSANNKRIIISNNTMKQLGNHGSHVGGSEIRVEGNVMEDIVNSGVLVRNFPNSGGTGAPLCTDIAVVNNTIKNVIGADGQSHNGITIANCENFIVRGNKIDGIYNVGVKVQGGALGNPIVTKNGVVDGNYIIGAGASEAGQDFSEGILVIGSHGVSVAANVIEGSYRANIKVKSGYNVTVNSNVVRGSIAGDGVLITPGSPETSACAVVGNTAMENAQHGIRLSTGSSRLSCVGNVSGSNGIGDYFFGTLTFSVIGPNAPS